MRRIAATALALLLVAGLLTACGDDSKDSKNPGGGSGIASKPADQIVKDAAEALKRSRSVHLEGTVSIDGRSTPVQIDLERKDLRFSFKQGNASVSVIVIGQSVYMKANAAFWRKQSGRAAEVLADEWIKVPTSEKELHDLTKDVNLATLSRCLATAHGTLRVAGKGTVNGRPTVVVVDRGDRPGTAPGRLHVATTGEPVPLRATTTGKQRPGGKKDPQCNDPDSPSSPGDEMTFSRYNEELNIEAPADARDLDLGGSAAGEPS